MIQNVQQFKEPEAQYHARDAITSHRLIDFDRNPYAFKQSKDGNPLYTRTPSSGMGLGSLVHLMLLEPERIGEVACGGPINPKTLKAYGSTSDKFAEWAAEQSKSGKIVVTEDDLAKATEMRDAVLLSEWDDISPFMPPGGVADGIVTENTFLGIIGDTQAQCKPDVWDAEENVCWDLKTTSKFDGFQWDCKDYGYYLQAAWYSTILKAVTGTYPEWKWIVVENVKPYRVKVVMRDAEIAKAMTMLESLVDRFIIAKTTGTYKRPKVVTESPDDFTVTDQGISL